jgi:myo-inositol-1(or 4)-monophosphatase
MILPDKITLEFAKDLVVEVGEFLLKEQKNRKLVSVDDVTSADKHHGVHLEQDHHFDAYIRETIKKAYPADSILGEESGLTIGTSNRTWMYDPLDGSSPYLHGSPTDWCVALGRFIQGEQIIAAVYIPGTDELFYAHKDHGAFLTKNRETTPLLTTDAKHLNEVIMSFGVDMFRTHRYDQLFHPFASAVQTFRVVRSGDLELCYAAAGRIGLIYNHQQKPWDCIGALILTEAGGRIRRYDPGKFGFAEKAFTIGLTPEERVSYLASGNTDLDYQAEHIIKTHVIKT